MERTDILAAIPEILREYTMQRMMEDEERRRALAPQFKLLAAVRTFNLAWWQMLKAYNAQQEDPNLDVGEGFLMLEDRMQTGEISLFQVHADGISGVAKMIEKARRERKRLELLAIARGTYVPR